jgi:hypothetical protein
MRPVFPSSDARTTTAPRAAPDDRITDVRQVHADLVGAAGFELHARERVCAKTLFDAVVSDGFPSIRAHRHLDALCAVTADGFIDATAAGHRAGADGQVFALDVVRGERGRQRGVRRQRAGHD